MKQSKLQLSCSRKLVSKTKVKPLHGGNIIDFARTIWFIREVRSVWEEAGMDIERRT